VIDDSQYALENECLLVVSHFLLIRQLRLLASSKFETRPEEAA
jgi:hypothetical protein